MVEFWSSNMCHVMKLIHSPIQFHLSQVVSVNGLISHVKYSLVAVELRSAACVVTVDFSLELLGRPSVPACRADWRGGLNSCPAVPAAVAAAVGANQILDILQVAPPLA